MRKRESIRLVVTVFTVIAVALFLPGLSSAGMLEPPPYAFNQDNFPVPIMKTLDQIPPTWSQKLDFIYDRFEDVLPIQACDPDCQGGN